MLMMISKNIHHHHLRLKLHPSPVAGAIFTDNVFIFRLEASCDTKHNLCILLPPF